MRGFCTLPLQSLKASFIRVKKGKKNLKRIWYSVVNICLRWMTNSPRRREFYSTYGMRESPSTSVAHPKWSGQQNVVLSARIKKKMLPRAAKANFPQLQDASSPNLLPVAPEYAGWCLRELEGCAGASPIWYCNATKHLFHTFFSDAITNRNLEFRSHLG